MILKIIYILLFLACGTVSAKDVHPGNAFMEFAFHFKLNDSQFDLDYMNNKKTYKNFSHYIDSIGSHHIDSILVITTSSPEGKLSYNAQLTQKRSNAVYHFIARQSKELSSKIIVKKEDEAWFQLRNFIRQDTVMSRKDREKAIYIIDNVQSLSKRKSMLAEQPYYPYLKENYYTRSRISIVTVYIKIISDPVPLEKAPRVVPSHIVLSKESNQDLSLSLARYQLEEPKRTLFTVKTNLLYDAITAVNFAIEVPIGERWSVELEDVCPWWHHENKWAFQLLQVGAEGRYWFKPSYARDVLTGQFGGFYAMGGKYDLQSRRDVCYQGEFWSVGASYGYAMPIGKHFNMEFSFSLGFMSTHYKHYNPAAEWENLVADKRKRGIFDYFGPTKLKISLIYPINVKIKKKGVHHD